MLVYTSCSNDDVPSTTIEQTSKIEAINNVDFENFMLSVDSLNATYESPVSRGFLGYFGKNLADQAGRAGGRFLGRWLGSAIGAAAANPALACIGYVGGQYVGGIVGYAAASAAADLLLCSEGQPSCPTGDMQLIVDFNIKPSLLTPVYSTSRSTEIDSRCDSIGYYHNYVMVKINQNKNKYLSDGSLNMDLLYNDIIRFFKEVGVYSEPLENNELVKTEIKKSSKDIALLTLQNLQNEGSEEQLVNLQCDYLENKCLVTSEELYIYRNFTLLIAQKCSELSETDIHLYANDLNTLIANSQLSPELKEEVAVSAMTTINSSLCWQQ
jgi:hypothetical protein